MITTTLNMRGLDNLAKRMATLSRASVKAGFFEDAKYDDGMSVATVAAWNEHGTRFHPERPFFQETLEDSATKLKIIHFLKLAAKSSIKGDGAAARIMKQLGEFLAGRIKITIGNYPGSNSESTISRKGFNRPLYDTGKMLESVTFKFGNGAVA